MATGKAALLALVVGVAGCARDGDGQVVPSSQATSSQATSARAISSQAPGTAAPLAASQALTDVPKGPKAVPAASADTLVLPGALRVELLSGGAMPRQPVRTSVKTGRREALELTADVGVTVAMGGGEPTAQTVPRLRVGLEGEVKVDADKPSLRVKLVNVAVEPNASGTPGSEVAQQAKVLEGLSFQIPLNERGRAGAPTVPSGASGPPLQLWSTVAEALREMIVPFPAEPIGRGAQWNVFERQPRAGVEMLRRTRYTLVKIEGEELSIRGEVHEVAISGGSERDPALPKEIRLNPIEGSASGEHSWRRPLLDAVLPNVSESQLRSRLVTDTHHELGSERVRGTVELRQLLRGKRQRKDEK